MIGKKSLADLDPWLERARSSLVASCPKIVLPSPHDRFAMVRRPNRRADHQTQACEASNIQQGENRPAPARVIGFL
jgi:hypothetical protein